jgi:hypothetical protein
MVKGKYPLGFLKTHWKQAYTDDYTRVHCRIRSKYITKYVLRLRPASRGGIPPCLLGFPALASSSSIPAQSIVALARGVA